MLNEKFLLRKKYKIKNKIIYSMDRWNIDSIFSV